MPRTLSIMGALTAFAVAQGCADPTQPVTRSKPVEAVAARAALTISIDDIGTLGGFMSVARATNDLGVIVGSSETCQTCTPRTTPNHAFVWRNGVMTDLGTLGGQNSAAFAINTAGEIVGSAAVPPSTNRSTQHAVVWRNNQIQDLGTLGGFGSVAYGINDNGVIVGVADVPPGGFVRQNAFVFQNGQMKSLGVLPGGDWSVAHDINNNGDIVGEGITTPGVIRPIVWHNGRRFVLGTLAKTQTAFATATAINDVGQIVGYSDTRNGPQHAFLFERGTGMVDLGSLSVTGSSQAYGINDQGQIVGASVNAAGFVHGVLWDHGQMIDLGLLPTGLVSSAFGINNAGLVVGKANTSRSGGANRDDHAVRWSLTP